ncbi:cell surface protein [Moraxella catarrhalis]|uniref:YadA-like family protein n=1 Tax=Moraxella catarrhalis TaxID=480 RepID=UPI00128CF61C|nr:YadA-like family protein [Moraxella catarrhalis]MPX50918.1 cell surface protein [Moraxella catarrhalis]MPX71990.1 cell surface protein [Moraxella catarrhalis]MPX75136.1 cell surface protein [Moraxella catarrhalis]
MNKIYKVKKNAAGHLVACSEFAKGHTKKAVLGSLLIVGALGMATTASARLVSVGSTTNKVNTVGAHVGGGDNNQAEGEHSTIGGGDNNTAEGTHSTIGGGFANTAEGTHSTIGGGYYSQAKGKYSTIGGGYGNQAEGEHSTIAGGRNNQAKGTGSFAAGVGNQANAKNAVAVGKENIINGDNSVAIGSKNTVAQGQTNVFILGSNTTNAQSGSVLLGNKTAGKTATAVNSAKVGDLNLTEFAGASAKNGVVSVGRAGDERQIVNVGAGNINANSTDAVNGSQLYALATVVAKNKSNITKNQADITKNQADIAKNIEKIENLKTDTLANRVSIQEFRQQHEKDIQQTVEMQNAIAEQADINKNHIQDLAKAQLAGVAVMEELDKHVEDLYEATNENLDKISQLDGAVFNNTQNIAKNSNHIKTLENNVEEELLNLSGRLLDQKADIDNNINNIYELAQQQDQHSSDIKTLKNNVEEGLLDLSGRLIDQKADLTKDIKALENNVEEGLLNLSGRLIDQKADIAKNQADIAQNQTDIQDLAAYNELQDAYAKQQTEAIDALNKASSANTDRIATAELGIAENKKDAQIAKAQANENKDGIAKNQADIQLHDKKITNLGILHSMVARAVGNNTQGVATNKADIAKNQADIANNIKNIYELAQQQDQHSSDIKTLAKVSTANTDRIAKNKAEADASFETLTKNQNTLIEQGEALVEQNKAINQELEGFAAHADVQDKQILQNQADITTNKAAIEQNINRTVANGFEIEKNKAGIATNKQELILQNDRLNRINETNNRQDQKIDQLGYALKEQGQHFNNRISAVERQTAGGIANAIAIATLPSPSRAGEHHVLFGSGYHNGQAAVSLGAAGLSDTGKSTYKIGLSWSDAGGLSGGVGGSYRWK